MSALDQVAARAAEMAEKLGGNLKGHLPDKAMKWVETGAALTALRSGTRVATRFARRNPVLAVAAVAGAGALWYAASRQAKRKQAENGELIEGESRRLDAKRIPRARNKA